MSSSEHDTGARPQSPRGSVPTWFQEKLKEGFPEEDRKAFPGLKWKKLAHRRRVLGYVPWSSAAPAALQSQGRTETPASRSQESTKTPASRSQQSRKTPASRSQESTKTPAKLTEGDQAGSPDCPWIKVRSRRRERPYMRNERSLPTVTPHRFVGRKVTTARDKTGVSPLHRPGTKEASRGEAKIVTDDQALPLEC